MIFGLSGFCVCFLVVLWLFGFMVLDGIFKWKTIGSLFLIITVLENRLGEVQNLRSK